MIKRPLFSANSRRKNASGFTLLEMAIVLVIIGVIAAVFFSLATIYIKRQKIENMKERLTEVRLALTRYVADDPRYAQDDPDFPDEVRFPCPASLTAPEDDPNFGAEICPSGAISAGDDLGGVFVINGSSGGLVLVGAVPTSTLGVSNNLMRDEYGNRFTYAVTEALTRDDALIQSSIAPGQITVIINDSDAPGPDVTTNADFFVVSHGEDGAGAYTIAGRPNGNECRTTLTPGDGDSQNCLWQTSLQAVFKDNSLFGFSTVPNDYFYDDISLYSLGEEEGWWEATDSSGQDIRNRNAGGHVYIRPNSRLGVGIDESMTPRQALDVQGSGIFTSRLGVGTTSPLAEMDVTGNATISGNLGIGTATPQAQLDVAGNVTVGGDVGVGTASPSSMLDVEGEIEAGNTGIDCTAANVGAMRYNSSRDKMEYCSTTGWRVFFNTSECIIRSGPVKNNASTVFCNADEFVISGGATCASGQPGGLCYGTADGNTKGYIHISRPISEGWDADCFGVKDDIDVCVQAHAVCCKK